ncbi:MAG TPA: trypsin-like peptidase domain-containing protein [candidate division Zixibacteria bacterium]|nr:trypsin-like peptidase domain-containing protein [candidate division Zixibacteria bacterium]
MGPIEQLGAAIAAVAETAGKSTVGIGNRWRGGSGVVVEDGKVLTNAHNLHGDEVRVFFADGREAEGRVLGVDADGDLAVIGVDTRGAPAVAWGDGGSLGIGSPVIAVGNPAGRGVRVTLGFVSGVGRSFRGPRGRRVAGAVEHTAPLLPGSSGGPIVDVDGRLLGINTNRLGSGFYQAIAADGALRERVAALGRGESPKRRRLGVGLAPAHVARQLRRAVGLDERDGLLVRDVEEGSPAAGAGIAEGDLIVAAAGRPVASLDDLFDAMSSVAADAPLEVTVLRGTEERTVSISA